MSSKVSRSALRRRKKNAMNVNVAIIGLNRISASFGLALRSINDRDHTDIVFTVLGRDEDNEIMKTAQRIGAIDNFNRSLQTVVEEADIVAIDVPMGDLEELFERLGKMLKPGAVVVDLSPLKQPGVTLAVKHFPKDVNGKLTAYIVGATPLISFDQIYVTNMDVEAADEFMFRNTDMIISPAASIPPEAVKVELIPGQILAGLATAVGVAGSGSIVTTTMSVLTQPLNVAVTSYVADPVPPKFTPTVGLATFEGPEIAISPFATVSDHEYVAPAGAVGAPPIDPELPSQRKISAPASTDRTPTVIITSSVNIQAPFVTVTV